MKAQTGRVTGNEGEQSGDLLPKASQLVRCPRLERLRTEQKKKQPSTASWIAYMRGNGPSNLTVKQSHEHPEPGGTWSQVILCILNGAYTPQGEAEWAERVTT